MSWYKQAQVNRLHRRNLIPFDEEQYNSLSQEQQDVHWRKLREKQKEWDYSTSKDISTGKLSPKDAFEIGYDLSRPQYNKEGYSVPGYGIVISLPEILYHVTTSKDAVILDQLKTRDELDQGGGAGLGGGTSDTISFTDNLEVAKDIYRTIIEGRKAMSGDLSVNDMISTSKKGENATESWADEWVESMKNYAGLKSLDEIRNYVNSDYEISRSMFPETLESFSNTGINKEYAGQWEPVESSRSGGEGLTYRQFKRPLNKKEKQYRKFRVYHLWAWARQHAGGPEYALFSFNDESALASIPEDQIAILEFRSRPGSMGYKVSALGEWRTWSGKAVDFVREIYYELV